MNISFFVIKIKLIFILSNVYKFKQNFKMNKALLFSNATQKLNIDINSLMDPRLIAPIVSDLFAKMSEKKTGSIISNHKKDLNPTPFLDDLMLYHMFYLKDSDDIETQMQSHWLQYTNLNWNHKKWPELYNSDEAQWWRNICTIYTDVRIGYFIIEGVKAGICKIDGSSENGLLFFSSTHLENKLHEDFFSKPPKENQTGITWLEKQPWFTGSSNKYYKNDKIWVINTIENMKSIPSEPRVEVEERKEQERELREKQEKQEKDNKERNTPQYKNEMEKLKQMVSYEWENYKLYNMDEPWTLAMKDRQLL